jgi:leucyl-tRNA synthetase
MEKYSHKKIEAKWQKKWKKSGIYDDYAKKKKFYALDMFPYPSGAGLHVGHPKGYIATDVVARFKMLNGYSVLHPMGWDAFGLPAENYAIKTKTHPREAVKKNIKTFKKQLAMFGFTYDWDREINTTDPEYYKWTQWIFLQLYKNGLAYEADEPVNWCPSCKTVLANEDLEGGVCERCGTQVIQKKMRQWVLKMTDYADRLLFDLDKEGLNWEEQIIEQQRNWIGRSEGVNFKNKVKDVDIEFEVYDSIPQTHMAQTFIVIAPEHPLVERLVRGTEYEKSVISWVEKIIKKKAENKFNIEKDKDGIFTGRYVENWMGTGRDLPIWVASFALVNYGTGIVNCSAHDERDFEFAKKNNIPLHPVLFPEDEELASKVEKAEVFYREPDGILREPKEFAGRRWDEVRETMINWLVRSGKATRAINYKMRDWVFSRQRYWGEPIPMIHCDKCGIVPVPEKDLPLKLPDVKSYKPTGTGESPLAKIENWVNVKCPKCGGKAKRETNTMPQWAGSSWYYLRYVDPKNKKTLIDKAKEKDWLPVDLYVGGAEHATRHLLYARFWHKFLFDLGVVSTQEPFKKLVHVGLINGEDGRKMSKRWGNVINPDEIINKYGADAIRLYEMFMGPFTQNIAWSTKGVIGIKRFLDRIWKFANDKPIKIDKNESNKKAEKLLHKTIKKVTEDIENFRFNTAISAMMILLNELEKENNIAEEIFKKFLIILSPFAPHIAEELWEKLALRPTLSGAQNKKSIFLEIWPQYDSNLIKDEEIGLVLQVNGKIRDTIIVSADISEEEAKKIALANEKIKKWIKGKEIVKIIYVKSKLVNIVVR